MTSSGHPPPTGMVQRLVALSGALSLLAAGLSWAGVLRSAGWDAAWTLSSLCALSGCLAARPAARVEHRARWSLWAAAAGLWVAGQLAWDVLDLTGSTASPNPADVCWWMFGVVAMVSMVRGTARRRGMTLLTALEAVPLIGAGVAFAIALMWSEVARSSVHGAAHIAVLVYPPLFVAVIVIGLQALLSGPLSTTRNRGTLIVLSGMLLEALSFIVWSSALLMNSPLAGRPLLDTGWVAGLCMMGAGGLLAARRPEGRSVSTDERNARGSLLPGGVFLGLLATLVAARFSHAPAGAATTLELGLVCSGGALMLRTTMLARRMQMLLQREREARESLVEREAQLAQINEQLVEDSRRDPLTGLRNRRALAEDLAAVEDARSEGEAGFAFALVDLDHFKSYNDRMGHLAGDQALKLVASVVRGALRAEDAAYRFGGEELLLLLRAYSTQDALKAAERVRAAIEDGGYPHPKGIGGVLTVSVGVAFGTESGGELIAKADTALYEAKRAGRNRVVVAGGDAQSQPTRLRSARGAPALPQQLRGLLKVARAGLAGEGATPVLQALTELMHAEMGFGVAAANLLDEAGEGFVCVSVSGDHEARLALEGTWSPVREWEQALRPERERCGAYWLPAGSYEWTDEKVWTAPSVPGLGADAWHPDDMLLLPVRAADGRTLGVISVDQPEHGHRPDGAELQMLMAVVDHAALAVEQALRAETQPSGDERALRMSAVMLLAEALDTRDSDTAEHSFSVGTLARQAAEELDLDPDRVERVYAAGVLHDLGKLGIADDILRKPGALDAGEWREMERHAEIGARILERAGLEDIAGWVRAHHERLDGRGYPYALDGPEIALEARILSVADAYEAMLADRPYRRAMTREQARAELLRGAGTQFDAEVVTAFLARVAPEGSPGQVLDLTERLELRAAG